MTFGREMEKNEEMPQEMWIERGEMPKKRSPLVIPVYFLALSLSSHRYTVFFDEILLMIVI